MVPDYTKLHLFWLFQIVRRMWIPAWRRFALRSPTIWFSFKSSNCLSLSSFWIWRSLISYEIFYILRGGAVDSVALENYKGGTRESSENDLLERLLWLVSEEFQFVFDISHMILPNRSYHLPSFNGFSKLSFLLTRKMIFF